jgi:hypothetical protein
MWSRSGTKIHRDKWTAFPGVSLKAIRTAEVKTLCYFIIFRKSILNKVMPAADLIIPCICLLK